MKSPEMTAFLNKITKSAFGKSRTEAIDTKACVSCHKRVKKFRDELSKREFLISGLCQNCQDLVFKED